MKKIISVFLLLMLTAFISVSCKSTPQPQEQTQVADSGTINDTPAPKEPTERVQRADQNMANAAKARTDAAKKQSVDYETPAYFPSEWEALETRYKAAEAMPKSNPDEVHKAVAEYDALTASYKEMSEKAIPLYAQAREDEILAVREKLINTGFTEYFPEYLEKADNKTLAALEQYEAGNYNKARETAAEALNEYETLLLGADVFLARQEIIDRDFVKYDEANFLKADEVAETVIKNYDAGNKEKAIENAQEALLRYNLVISNGWTAYSAECRTAADTERELALAERANIASRDIFREAEDYYNQAERFVAAKNYNAAAIQYTEAEAMYLISRKDTAEKRQRAETTIKKAEEKIIESGDTASGAERVIEGGSR